jgi:adenine-specific DNA-methyltransferase
MKYMGSKRAMLLNGLGTLLEREIADADRFVDLFTGSAAVANHVAQKYDIPVLASDLQAYSVVLANAVIQRRQKLDWKRLWGGWRSRAENLVKSLPRAPSISNPITRKSVEKSRNWCANRPPEFKITAAYGGHYFSPQQAIWIDALRATLPKSKAARTVGLAALIQAASQCAAAPGHTAQPFQPTRTAKKFLKEAWSRSVLQRTKEAFIQLCDSAARKKGFAQVVDANLLARKLRKGDLVFIDPPYSGVHYSRFYHVLESIARGRSGIVTGTGRYPDERHRPRSRYSLQSEASNALDSLLKTIAGRGSKIILTFPNHVCSNGLSGNIVYKIALRHFDVMKKSIASRFSSLGGTSDNRGNQAGRAARRHTRELVLTLKPALYTNKS